MSSESISTEVLIVDPSDPADDAIDRAAVVLLRGGLVAFPTETVYGLGADALNAEAGERIFVAKGRPANNPVIVHVAGAEEIERVAVPNAAAESLAARFWPGPLTLVLPKTDVISGVVTAGGPTVAVRAPLHPVAQALIRATGRPIAAPSANRSARLSPTRAEHVLKGLNGRIEMVLDGGPTAGGIESTVLDVTTDPPRLLRPGLVTPSQIESIIGPIAIGRASVSADEALPSPGMLRRHYSPRTPLECVERDGGRRAEKLAAQGYRVGLLSFMRSMRHASHGIHAVAMPEDPARYAAELYAVLHEIDESGADRIVVELPPDTAEWMAVRDRLRRAAATE